MDSYGIRDFTAGLPVADIFANIGLLNERLEKIIMPKIDWSYHRPG
jgi:hypothetical protein